MPKDILLFRIYSTLDRQFITVILQKNPEQRESAAVQFGSIRIGTNFSTPLTKDNLILLTPTTFISIERIT